VEVETLDLLNTLDTLLKEYKVMKEGFVYIWLDRKRKMYYVGCHWGNIDDGYICSSNRMRDAYRRRPHSFKRRILKRYIVRDKLLEEEYKWLKLIPNEKLGKKYYNLSNRHFGHWSANSKSYITTTEKISKTLRMKFDLGTMSKTNKGSFTSSHIPWNKNIKIGKQSEEHIKKAALARTGKKRGPYKGKVEYSNTHQKNINNIEPCRTGKGGKYKPVMIDDLIYVGIVDAAKSYGVSTKTIHKWIETGKAKIL
jgi:hypothetical protein